MFELSCNEGERGDDDLHEGVKFTRCIHRGQDLISLKLFIGKTLKCSVAEIPHIGICERKVGKKSRYWSKISSTLVALGLAEKCKKMECKMAQESSKCKQFSQKEWAKKCTKCAKKM